MSTATSSDYTAPTIGGRYHFLLRRLHSLTGLVFGGYLVVHLIVNATLAQLGDVYQLQVNKIHSLPLLTGIEWTLIYLPIMYHTVYGIWIVLTMQPNVLNYPYIKNWFYFFQRVSAVIIVLFILFHVLSLKYGLFGPALTFDHQRAVSSIHTHMVAYWWVAWIVYPIGILASCYHLANGFWAAAITWGLTVSANSHRRWGYICAGVFVLTMVLGFTALVAAVRVAPPEAPVLTP